MGVNRSKIVSIFGILTGLGLVSYTFSYDLQRESIEQQGNKLQARTLSQGSPLQSQSKDDELFRQINQDNALPKELFSSDNSASLAQLNKSRQAKLGMMKVSRSHNSPYSFPSRSSASSATAPQRSRSSSSSLPVSSLSLPSPLSLSRRQISSSPVPNSIAQLAEARRQAARARQRELRTQGLRQSIMNGLGVRRAPSPIPRLDPETRTALLNWVVNQDQTGSFRLVQRARVQRNCFLGQCSVPLGVNATLWQELASDRLRLHFHLPRLNRRRGRREELQQAQLNLFVKPREGCPCNDENGDQLPGYTVSIRQFTRRLVKRKRRVVHRTILLGSARIPFDGNAWLRMNVTRAVQTWLHRPRRNLGLEIQVKNNNGTPMDARSMLVSPDCESTQTETSCVIGSRPGLQFPPWPQTSHDRHLQVLYGRPYLDLQVVDRSRTYWEVVPRLTSAGPQRLGHLNDFLASQGKRRRNTT